MRTEKTIPIVVGVTAHRHLRPEDEPALTAAVTEQLQALQRRCPHSTVVMLTSMAEGGDMLCAGAARALGIPLAVALPMEREAYIKDFPPQDRERFNGFCADALTVFTVPAAEEEPGEYDADFRYRQAGIYVAAHCHVLLALWDGAMASPDGCGTAEAVEFALRGGYRPRKGMVLRSGDNTAVLHVFTPRGSRTETPAGEVEWLGDAAARDSILADTDTFNRLAEGDKGESTLLPAHGEDPVLDKLEAVYGAADALSIQNARKYQRVLAVLAAVSTVVAVSFLLYDEVALTWMLLVCGAMLVCAWLCRLWAVRSDCHRRYIDYRVLAESLRVQSFLRYAGSPCEAAGLFTWSQRQETAWVMDGLCALSIGPGPAAKHDIQNCWVDDQRKYHAGACTRVKREYDRSERMVSGALIASVVLYVAALAFELLFGGLLRPPVYPLPWPDLCRVVLKVALGSLSAATLFIANYHGKLSLPRKLSDHEKMEKFYTAAARQLERCGQTEELLEQLGRQELAENANWCAYQRDNKPDINL